jgi:hypothetical protein
MYELWATCTATGADMQNPSYMHYWLMAHLSGSSTCICPDWINCGGACKHLHAFWLLIEDWAMKGKLQSKYSFPQMQDEAIHIQDQNHLWYGANYEDAVTQPAVDAAEQRLASLDPETPQINPITNPVRSCHNPVTISSPVMKPAIERCCFSHDHYTMSQKPQTPPICAVVSIYGNSRVS